MNSDAKTFRVTEIKKEARALSYVVQIESADGAVEVRMPFSLRFNKDVLIYNSSILYMFETIFNAPQNKKTPDATVCKWIWSRMLIWRRFARTTPISCLRTATGWTPMR